MAHDVLGKKKPAAKKSLFSLILFLALPIIALEFFYDLSKEFLLYQIAIALDALLLILFLSFVGLRIFHHRGRLLELINREKADVAYLVVILCFLFVPRLAAGLVIVRLFIAAFMHWLETSMGSKHLARLNLRPSQTLALSFVGLIGIGTLLLTFPAATTNGRGDNFIDALFTMTSASCVVGLVVHDIGTYFTRFGQGVIILGMQAGGLGIMVLSAAFAVLVGGTIPSRRQAGLGEVLDVTTPEGLRSLIRAVTAATVVTEFCGAFALFFLWEKQIPGTAERAWWAIFHAVSAFCNVGLSLSATNLIPFVDQWVLCFVFMALITIGGIGFFVIADLTNPEVWEIKRPKAIWDRLQIQTKVVLLATFLLDSLGMLFFLFFEYDGALHGLSAGDKIVASLLYSVSLRTAGFSSVPLGQIVGPTVIFSIAFMFIGANPGSTGGGIKTTTAAVSIVALRTMLRGREDVELFGRRMPSTVVNRSLSIMMVAAMIVGVFLALLLATQEIQFERLFYETISAFSTVGFSMDATLELNGVGRLLIICIMYIGRIGPLTLALAVGERRRAQGYLLPKGRIAVG